MAPMTSLVASIFVLAALTDGASSDRESKLLVRADSALMHLVPSGLGSSPHRASPTPERTRGALGSEWLITHTDLASGSMRVLLRTGHWAWHDGWRGSGTDQLERRLCGTLHAGDGWLYVLTWESRRRRGRSLGGAFQVRAFDPGKGGVAAPPIEIAAGDVATDVIDPTGTGPWEIDGDGAQCGGHRFLRGERVAEPPPVEWGATVEGWELGVRAWQGRARVGETLDAQVLVRRVPGTWREFPSEIVVHWGDTEARIPAEGSAAGRTASGISVRLVPAPRSSDVKSWRLELPCARVASVALSAHAEIGTTLLRSGTDTVEVVSD